MFYGPPGTGKTSTILAVARELYGPKLMKSRVKELNASSDRGISAVRESIKSFAKLTVSNEKNGYPCPPYKIIILDEADSMTKDAQTALRRTMEAYSKVTRFCIICNYVTRIIEPITSRCAKFRYSALSHESISSKLNTICVSEGVNCSKATIDQLIDSSGGDLRRAIMLLQTTQRSVRPGQEITPAEIRDIAGGVPKALPGALVAACKSSYSTWGKAVDDVIANGYPVAEILPYLAKTVAQDSGLTDVQKSRINIEIADAERKLIDGADEWLQLLHVASVIARQAGQK